MITFRTSTEVTTERSVVLALPPETPLGKVELTVTISPSAPAPTRSGNLSRYFGAIHSRDPRAADNDRIDADLARFYDHSRE